jgi:hypothetical protein
MCLLFSGIAHCFHTNIQFPYYVFVKCKMFSDWLFIYSMVSEVVKNTVSRKQNSLICYFLVAEICIDA